MDTAYRWTVVLRRTSGGDVEEEYTAADSVYIGEEHRGESLRQELIMSNASLVEAMDIAISAWIGANLHRRGGTTKKSFVADMLRMPGLPRVCADFARALDNFKPSCIRIATGDDATQHK